MSTKTTTNGSSANVSLDDLSAQIAVLKDDLSKITTTLGAYGDAKTTEMTDAARAKAQQMAETGKATAQDAQVRAEHFIQTQPATALGIAAGLGFVIGMMTSRK